MENTSVAHDQKYNAGRRNTSAAYDRVSRYYQIFRYPARKCICRKK